MANNLGLLETDFTKYTTITLSLSIIIELMTLLS